MSAGETRRAGVAAGQHHHFISVVVPRCMPTSLYAGLLAFGLLACSGRGNADVAHQGEVAPDKVDTVVSTAHTLAIGTVVQATIQDTVSSLSNAPGQRVTAIVSRNVMDGRHVVIPGGAAIVLTIVRLLPARTPADADGVIALEVTSMTVGDKPYAPGASVGSVPHTLKGRAVVGRAGPTTVGDRDVIVTPGTPITITLKQQLRIPAN